MTARLVVHVVPRARRTELAGRYGDAVKIKLKAPPVDGAANAELVRFLAAQLGIPRARVTVASGHAGRRKTVEIEGVTTAAAVRALTAAGSRPG